jgi:hypothetical protein
MKIKLTLTQKEIEILQKTLDHTTSEIRLEMGRTDEPSFRAGLQEELNCLKSIENRLEGYLRGTIKQEPEEGAA